MKRSPAASFKRASPRKSSGCAVAPTMTPTAPSGGALKNQMQPIDEVGTFGNVQTVPGCGAPGSLTRSRRP